MTALSRKLKQSHDITLEGCAIVTHQYELLTYKTDKYSDVYFSQTKNPAACQHQQNNIGATPPVIEEGKMHLTVSLLIECQGFSGTDTDKRNLEEHIKKLCFIHRLAGGIITDITDVIYENINDDKAFYQCRRRLMPGFILIDQSQYLSEYLSTLKQDNPDAEMLDAWLDFCAIKYQAEALLEDGEALSNKTKAHWQYISKPASGYLVPITMGYQAISEVYPAGEVKNTRDNTTPFCFIEAIYGIGEWLSPHRLSNLDNALWRYYYENEKYYLCKQEIVTNIDDIAQIDDIDELFFED